MPIEDDLDISPIEQPSTPPPTKEVEEEQQTDVKASKFGLKALGVSLGESISKGVHSIRSSWPPPSSSSDAIKERFPAFRKRAASIIEEVQSHRSFTIEEGVPKKRSASITEGFLERIRKNPALQFKSTVFNRPSSEKLELPQRLKEQVGKIKQVLSEYLTRFTLKLDPTKLGEVLSKELDGVEKSAVKSPPIKTSAQGSIQKNQEHVQLAQNISETLKEAPIGKGNIEVNGKQIAYEKSVDSTDVSTIKFTLEGQNYEVNEFKEDTYNGLKKEDFSKRIDLYIRSAKNAIDSQKNLSIDETKGLLRSIDIQEQEIRDELEPLLQTNKNLEETFLENGDQFKEVLANGFKNIENIVKVTNPNFNLEKAERLQIIKDKRPIIINFYQKTAPKDSSNGGKQFRFFSIQTPASEKTIPSSIQVLGKAANYVNSSAGVITDQGNIEVKYNTVRHSRPTPIAIENSFSRNALGAGIVKQTIQDIVSDQLQGEIPESSAEEPLSIDISVTTLLTAKNLDFLRNKKKGISGKWTGESETLQLHEASKLYQLYNNRAVRLEVNGKTIWVKPNFAHTNFGVNPAGASSGLAGKIPDDALQEKLNAQGLITYGNRIGNVLDGLKKAVKEKSHLPPFLAKLEPNSELKNLENQYQEASQKISQELNGLKEKLESEYTQLAKQINPATEEQQEKIQSLSQQIDAGQEKVFQFALALNSLQKQNFLQNREATAQALLILKEEIPKEHRHDLQILEEWFNVQDSVYGNANKDVETVMDPAVNINHLNSKLGTANMSYCKSAEDRTGNVEVKGIAKMMYETIYETSTPSSLKVGQEHAYNDFFAEAHNWSASLNNTEQNSAARGLQVSSKTTPPKMKSKIDAQKMMAGFAKKVPLRSA